MICCRRCPHANHLRQGIGASGMRRMREEGSRPPARWRRGSVAARPTLPPYKQLPHCLPRHDTATTGTVHSPSMRGGAPLACAAGAACWPPQQ